MQTQACLSQEQPVPSDEQSELTTPAPRSAPPLGLGCKLTVRKRPGPGGRCLDLICVPCLRLWRHVRERPPESDRQDRKPLCPVKKNHAEREDSAEGVC